MIEIPPRGTRDREIWLQGARAESTAQVEGMTVDGREIFNYVEALAKHGNSPEKITSSVAFVFTSDWTWRARWKLARKILFRRRL